MDSSQNSDPSSSPETTLLPGFLSVKQIQDLPSAALKQGQLINVFGFPKDFQPPIKTSGTDWKCTFEIKDSSVGWESSGVKMNVFWPPNHMPTFSTGDAVLVRNVKAQIHNGSLSLLSNRASEIHVLSASQIPTSLPISAEVPWRSYCPYRVLKSPTTSETVYVAQANEKVADLSLFSTMEFQQRAEQATSIKDKFALLKDVKIDRFYNILGHVIQIYDAPSGHLTLHFSDYTANSDFYDHVWGGGESTEGRDGDEHGYIKSRPKPVTNWDGPFGKMTIQITLFDEHANFVREEVKAQDWLLLKNVRIAYGKMGGCLEGRLHGDGGRVHVEIMKRPENGEEADHRWKAAVSRKLEWKKNFEKDKQRIQNKGSAGKRKREDEPPKKNSKARRKEKRAGGVERGDANEQKLKVKLDLNENILCEALEKGTVLLADILKPRTLVAPKDSGREYAAPFDIRKCKANVRVIGYFPSSVEDFAVGRRPSADDIVSDYDGGEETDPEEAMRAFKSGNARPEKEWEWRFALQVVDASDKSFKESTWLLVNNYDAQMLLNMEPTNLRRDREALRDVKEQLFKIWGDLEEKTSALALAKAPKIKSVESKSPPLPSYKPGDQPSLDSDDEQENEDLGKEPSSKSFHSRVALSERDPNAGPVDLESAGLDPNLPTQVQFANKAFTCCIKQYGVKVKEEDPALASAGDGKRWQRKFGLFGTQIR